MNEHLNRPNESRIGSKTILEFWFVPNLSPNVGDGYSYSSWEPGVIVRVFVGELYSYLSKVGSFIL